MEFDIRAIILITSMIVIYFGLPKRDYPSPIIQLFFWATISGLIIFSFWRLINKINNIKCFIKVND